ncbi:MAG TPA: helix-turn-helix domain-containing protein, partial [Streptosporangiaceae bacterium]
EMLQGLLEGAVVTRRLVANGFSVDRRLRLAVVPADADDDRAADALASAGFPHLILRQQDELLVLIQDRSPDRSVLTGVLAVGVGFSRPFAADGSVAVARREARWALARALDAGRAVVTYGDDRTEKWLTSETSDLRALADQVLGTVLTYDAAHSTDLVPSVRVWLEHDRQTDRAARALHIHPNTLLYRIRRFEHLSGRSLASTESLAEVWLALRTTAAAPDG